MTHKRKFVMTGIFIAILSMSFVFAPLAMSAPGKIKKANSNKGGVSGIKDNDTSERKVELGEDKKKPSAKKKVLKKAGTAVAVGVVGSKAKGGVKNALRKD